MIQLFVPTAIFPLTIELIITNAMNCNKLNCDAEKCDSRMCFLILLIFSIFLFLAMESTIGKYSYLNITIQINNSVYAYEQIYELVRINFSLSCLYDQIFSDSFDDCSEEKKLKITNGSQHENEFG